MTPFSRDQMAVRVAADIPDGSFVNLGIGLPTLISTHLPAGRQVIFHSENGILNMGPKPPEGQEDAELINAGKAPVTILPGGSYFDTSVSFSMMRGGHLDIAVLGAFEVACSGDIANWTTGDPRTPPGVGGAMDLACGARAIWVLMEHTTRDGKPRIVRQCSLPLTARRVVQRIYTDLAILAPRGEGLEVLEILADTTFEHLQSLTAAPLYANSTVL